MSDYPYVCYWRDLKELFGQPCRLLERRTLASSVLIEFQSGERKRVPAATIRRRKPVSKREVNP